MKQETKLRETLWKEHSLDVEGIQLRTFMFQFKKGDKMGLSRLFKYCMENHQELYDFMVERTDIPLYKSPPKPKKKWNNRRY